MSASLTLPASGDRADNDRSVASGRRVMGRRALRAMWRHPGPGGTLLVELRLPRADLPAPMTAAEPVTKALSSEAR